MYRLLILPLLFFPLSVPAATVLNGYNGFDSALQISTLSGGDYAGGLAAETFTNPLGSPLGGAALTITATGGTAPTTVLSGGGMGVHGPGLSFSNNSEVNFDRTETLTLQAANSGIHQVWLGAFEGGGGERAFFSGLSTANIDMGLSNGGLNFTNVAGGLRVTRGSSLFTAPGSVITFAAPISSLVMSSPAPTNDGLKLTRVVLVPEPSRALLLGLGLGTTLLCRRRR